MKRSYLFLIGLLSFPLSVAFATQAAVVQVPVADVWSRPPAAGETPKDELRETQVLFGERVIVQESTGPWARIEVVDQPTFRQYNRLEGYPGWILKSARRGHQGNTGVALANGRTGMTSFEGTLNDPHPLERIEWYPGEFRQRFIRLAKLLIGDPYLWGGLTPNMDPGLRPAGMTSLGVDCSGLVHLVYRINGMTIPRDAHEQWMKATPIKRTDLKPADLIFSAKIDHPKIISHVALYAGEGQIIEAPQTGMVVRKISFKEKYGAELSQVESGQTVGERVIYFGRFIP